MHIYTRAWMEETEKKKKKKRKSSRAGLEPATFELEVQCANPLRHRDIRLLHP